MSRTSEFQTTTNDNRVETAMDTLRSRNTQLILSTFCLGNCTNYSCNDTHLSCTQPYQLLFFVCHNCQTSGKELEVAATILENCKKTLDYELCQKIFVLRDSEILEWTDDLRWILDPSARMVEKEGSSCFLYPAWENRQVWIWRIGRAVLCWQWILLVVVKFNTRRSRTQVRLSTKMHA